MNRRPYKGRAVARAVKSGSQAASGQSTFDFGVRPELQDLANMDGQRLEFDTLPGEIRRRKDRYPNREFPWPHHWNVVLGTLYRLSKEHAGKRFKTSHYGERAHFVRCQLRDGRMYRFEAPNELQGKKWAACLADHEGVAWAEYAPKWLETNEFDPRKDGSLSDVSTPALGSAPGRAPQSFAGSVRHKMAGHVPETLGGGRTPPPATISSASGCATNGHRQAALNPCPY